MSCFKIPQSLSNDIHAMLQKFGGNVMCWVTWDKLCWKKAIGGIGFQYLETFNKVYYKNNMEDT